MNPNRLFAGLHIISRLYQFPPWNARWFPDFGYQTQGRKKRNFCGLFSCGFFLSLREKVPLIFCIIAGLCCEVICGMLIQFSPGFPGVFAIRTECWFRELVRGATGKYNCKPPKNVGKQPLQLLFSPEGLNIKNCKGEKPAWRNESWQACLCCVW